MYEGGKFEKAAAAKEEPGEKDAPPSYAAYRGCIIKRRDTPKTHERGCCWGRVRRRFSRPTVVIIPVMLLFSCDSLELNVSKFCRSKNMIQPATTAGAPVRL